jgi:hypothetical protein
MSHPYQQVDPFEEMMKIYSQAFEENEKHLNE